jgi:hypothetical protein
MSLPDNAIRIRFDIDLETVRLLETALIRATRLMAQMGLPPQMTEAIVMIHRFVSAIRLMERSYAAWRSATSLLGLFSGGLGITISAMTMGEAIADAVMF